MEQRRLRLGDILDDYCPRERRLTNHAVVAMIEDTVKQTRCTTCDAEHPYKGGQAPRRKRKESAPAALFKEVLAGKPSNDASATTAPATDIVAESSPAFESTEEDFHAMDMAHDDEALEMDAVNGVDGADHGDESNLPEIEPMPSDPGVPDVEDGPVHRPLIRATLPRPEGQKDARTPPEFTVRQAGGRGNQPGNAQFRGGNNRGRQQRGGGQAGNGHRPFGNTRFAGARPGQGPGRGQGGGNFRSGQQQRHGGGGRKRSR
jgi:hypothetical protein